MVASQYLPAQGEEETGMEAIPSQVEDNSLACQSFEKALFGWS